MVKDTETRTVLFNSCCFHRGANIHVPYGEKWQLRKILRVQGDIATLTLDKLDIVDWLEHFYYKTGCLILRYFRLWRKK